MSLADKLNKGVQLPPFQNYRGPIPKTVPLLRLYGRTFAGGELVFHERLAVLTPNKQGEIDKEKIDRWGQSFSLADLCATFEDLFKLQTDSGFLTGIRGIVEKDGQTYVAVDADAIEAAIKRGTTRYFEKQFSASETASYQTRGGSVKKAQVQDVILFPYNRKYISFTADQFGVIDAKSMKRQDVINGRDMEPTEIVKDNEVVHLAWKIYPAKIIVPLVEKQRKFTFEGKDYEFNDLMGFFLPNAPSSNQAEGRALYVNWLDIGSRLCGYLDLGLNYDGVVGVDNKYAKCAAKK